MSSVRVQVGRYPVSHSETVLAMMISADLGEAEFNLVIDGVGVDTFRRAIVEYDRWAEDLSHLDTADREDSATQRDS